MTKFDKSMFKYLVDETMRLPRTNKVWTFYGSSIGVGKFIDKVNYLTGYLQKLGVGKGDNVILCLGNIPDAIVAFYAINNTGAVANIVHPLIPSKALYDIYVNMNSKAFFIFDEFYSKYDWLKDCGKHVILCSACDFLPKLLIPAYKLISYSRIKNIEYNNHLHRFKDAIKPISYNNMDIKGEDIAIYMHSGGTTGKTKTVMLSNRAFNHLADNLLDLVGGGLDDKDGMLMVLPIFHTFGLGVCMHTTISSGGQAILMPKFNAKRACDLVRRRNATYISGVPNMYAKMLYSGKFKGKYLKKIKNCYCGGDILSAKIKADFENQMAKYGNPIKLCTGYGLTEGGVCCVNTMDIHKEGTLGKAVKNVKFAIVDDNNNFLEPYNRGMIVINTQTMMTGYYNDEEMTKLTIFEDDKGRKWLKTGDIGYMDNEDYVYFVDRLKRMVKISGVNVYPQEIEDCIYGYKGVDKCCVIGVLNNGKQELKLYIKTKDGVEFNNEYIQGVREYIGQRMLKYSVPGIIEQIDNMPLTQIGKVDFKKLQELSDKGQL